MQRDCRRVEGRVDVHVDYTSLNSGLFIAVAVPALTLGLPQPRGLVLAEILQGVSAAYDEAVAQRDAVARIRTVSKPARKRAAA